MADGLVLAGIRWEAIGPALFMSLVIMGSPGPATISLVAAASVQGVRRSVPYLVGIILGTTLVLVAVASGITAALLAIPAVGSALTAISAAYILWLAFRIATTPPVSEQTAGQRPFSLAGGALLGLGNPKAWIAIAAVFASAHLADAAATDAAVKIAVLTAMIIVICATWLLAGTSLTPLLRHPQRARVVNAALAVLLVGATGLAVFH